MYHSFLRSTHQRATHLHGPVSYTHLDVYKRQVYANVDTWLWQDGSTGSQLTVTNAGTINVAVTNSCATEYDTIVVAFLPPIPILDLGPDTSICPGASRCV